MSWLPFGRRRSSARRALSSLAHRLGLQTDAPWDPGLLAAVDQHAAAVRDILLLSGERLGVVELACYAQGIEDVAREHGWDGMPPADDDESPQYWVYLRLAGVCMLARAEGALTSRAGGDATAPEYPGAF